MQCSVTPFSWLLHCLNKLYNVKNFYCYILVRDLVDDVDDDLVEDPEANKLWKRIALIKLLRRRRARPLSKFTAKQI